MIARVATLFVTILGVVTLVFWFVHLVPGDPIDVMLGETARPADRAALRAQLGLDRPIAIQYGAFLGGLATGDLGRSIVRGTDVVELVARHLPATIALAIAGAAVAAAIAFPLGLVAAARPHGWVDASATAFSLVGASLPNFALGPFLILAFSIRIEWFPVSGADGPASLVLPAVTLGLGMSAILTRLIRASLLDALGSDWIRTARSKGVGPAAILGRHALRNALLPVTTVFGLQIGGLLGGALVTETIFAWPGIGRLTLEAINGRDYPLVQGCVLAIALGYVAVNAATDLLYARLDPRIRIGGEAA